MNWKIVKDWPYMVSDTGIVKHRRTGWVLKPRLTKKGYHRIVLYLDGRKKDIFIHRLVALAFIDNPNVLPVVNHKDGNKTNNNSQNLEWCSIGYNQLHAYKIGLRKKLTGENHWRFKHRQTL